MVFRKREKRSVIKLTEEEKDQLIAEWIPDPLVPEQDVEQLTHKPKYVDGKMGKYVSIEGKQYLNAGTTNFLGFVGDSRIEVSFYYFNPFPAPSLEGSSVSTHTGAIGAGHANRCSFHIYI